LRRARRLAAAVAGFGSSGVTIATMALTTIEVRRCEQALARFLERRRPPVHLRDQVDIGYRLDGHSVEIFEVRPDWQDKTTRTEVPIAKATFVRTRNHWKVFWMRRDLKWHGYEPNPEVQSLEAFLNVVDRDESHCFFG
jgi:Protein of unknown function (DUF3024)